MKAIILVAIASGLIPDEVIYVGNKFFVCRLGNKFGLYDHQSRKMEIEIVCNRIEHFPNTTHVWVVCDKKIGLFDTELRKMILPVYFRGVFHTPKPDIFAVWMEDETLGVAVELFVDTSSLRA